MLLPRVEKWCEVSCLELRWRDRQNARKSIGTVYEYDERDGDDHGDRGWPKHVKPEVRRADEYRINDDHDAAEHDELDEVSR